MPLLDEAIDYGEHARVAIFVPCQTVGKRLY